MLHILITALNAVLPVVLLILLGYLLKQGGFLSREFVKMGNKLVFNVCLPCKKELEMEGFTVTENLDEVECIVMGFDTELTFKKLEDVSKLLLTRPELPYIATNPDLVCPTEYGSVPDCGSVCEMIYNATKKRPVVIGKPSPLMPQLAMSHSGFSKEESAVFGDRIYTDVKSGLNAGILSVLVMSGETTYEILEASEEKPHFVMESAKEILEILKGE